MRQYRCPRLPLGVVKSRLSHNVAPNVFGPRAEFTAKPIDETDGFDDALLAKALAPTRPVVARHLSGMPTLVHGNVALRAVVVDPSS